MPIMLPSQYEIIPKLDSHLSDLFLNRAAMISLTQQLAYELRRPDLGIRVNNIAPGYFSSEVCMTIYLPLPLSI
jgi:hypothetical protein